MSEREREAPERELEQQILRMRKQHELQHQILLQHFQQQQQHLAEQHKQQLRRYQEEFWERQKQLQEMRQREQLEALRRKEKHEESAIASDEVKHKLQAFLRQRATAAKPSATGSRVDHSCWSEGMETGSDTSGPNNDFPLRKTASEPNLLKVRLKQRVMERRCSPMSKRHLPPSLKKKILSSCLHPSSSESPPQESIAAKELSPPRIDPIQPMSNAGNALFSSPSMPNICLGGAAGVHHLAPADLSEAAVRAAACTARLGMPLTGQMLPGTLPFYPSLPAIESSEHEDHGTNLDTISELQEPPLSARGAVRPLGRTQSSPLPLGHPLLEGGQPPPLMLPQPPQPPPPIEDQREDDATDLRTGDSRSSIRPLSRAVSSPVVHLSTPDGLTLLPRRRASSTPTTGLAYDNQMLKHACSCGNNALHPEHAGRLQSIWSRLLETGLVSRCDRLRPRKATAQELQACHTESHAVLYGTSSLSRHKIDAAKLGQVPVAAFVRLPCGGIGIDSDTTWNELYTAPAARMAVGCTIDLAVRCWTGDIRNGFAVVRPPGHHAEPQQAMGFCYFNSVAIAARILQRDHRVHKILIFDWDVHHGNGTQEIFYDDPRVLVISVHRHDDGNFFPGTGSPGECGSGAGLGFNVNVAWSGGLEPPLGDAEYLAAFRTVVMPIACEFSPDIVLVSAGFDAAEGHQPPLGGYRVSPACFGYMTRQLMQLANGRVVLALEGGYDLPSICDAAEECVRVLLGDQPAVIAPAELGRVPCANAVLSLRQVLAVQAVHWPCLHRGHTETALLRSHNDTLGAEPPDDQEAPPTTAMAGLSMRHPVHHHRHHPSPGGSPDIVA